MDLCFQFIFFHLSFKKVHQIIMIFVIHNLSIISDVSCDKFKKKHEKLHTHEFLFVALFIDLF